MCCGGTTIAVDKKILSEGVHIVVGTPGRVHDMMNRGILKTTGMKIIVLDEADNMLGQGFEE